ncbi:hypothetical protein QTH91_08160 [Variovorax dokdonensis]|uniref:Uncharacterized protein n=1 Tax=Variovorax dokdonensis TaxID=344883 RepID=A0ABT7N954_9BURK|nr:hypothetical protein [Variovorax dokdonensis]MDM0044448.1 hypothetical protein [Variovorax dokdonensis]
MEQLNQQSGHKDPKAYKDYALKTFGIEKERVARLRDRGLLQ